MVPSSVYRLESQLKKLQLTHREELAEGNAKVQLAKSKTVSVIEAKRELGLRYQKCMGQRKEMELKIEKLIHDDEQTSRNHTSEKNILERKIRTIKEKVERGMNMKMSTLAAQLETAREEFETEREHHQSTHTALEQAGEEIDTLVVKLAEAHEGYGTPISLMQQEEQQYQQQQQQQYREQQYREQQYQEQQQQQQQQPRTNVHLSSTYGGASISHQSHESFQQTYNPTIEETEKEETREQELIQKMMQQQQQQQQQQHTQHQSVRKIPRPQSAGRTRSRLPQWTAADEAAAQQQQQHQQQQQAHLENAGKPPLPPSQRKGTSRKNSTSGKSNGGSRRSPTIPAPPLSPRGEDMDEEGVDLEVAHDFYESDNISHTGHIDRTTTPEQPRLRSLPLHVLESTNGGDSGGMESPGQRAAAAIAGAMQFVQKRTQKRRERRFDVMLGEK